MENNLYDNTCNKLHEDDVIEDDVISDTNKFNSYGVNNLEYSYTQIKMEKGLKHKNHNVSSPLSSVCHVSPTKIQYFDAEKITSSKKRKSEDPWTICKKSSNCEVKIDKSENNIFKNIPNQSLDISEINCIISTPENAVSLWTKEDKKEIWPTDYNNQMTTSLASSNSMPELCEHPNTYLHDRPTKCETSMLGSPSCGNTDADMQKRNECFVICNQHQKCHSAPTSTSFPSTSRNFRRNRLFTCQVRNSNSPSFEVNKSFLSKRFSSYHIPSYDVSDFDKLAIGYLDTHCHLDFLFQREGFRGTYEEYKTKHSNDFPHCYEGCIAIFCDPLTFEMKTLWESLIEEKGVWAAFGCHPHSAGDFDSVTENFLREILKHPRVVALGEIGLDYSSRNSCDHSIQHDVFRKQLRLAVEAKMPIVVHCRDAHRDCLQILKEEVPLYHRIHRHCFTGEWKEAEMWLNTFPNLCLGFTGLVTFPSAKEVHEVVKKIPLNRLLLETDAPYFVPRHETIRDQKWSRPGMALHVAAQIAALRPEVTLEELLQAVRRNTYTLYSC